MRQLLLISFILITIQSESTFGCAAIDQYRSYPIGTSIDGLIVFETYMLRDDNGEKWTGMTSLNIYNSTFKKTTLVDKSKYINTLKKSFLKALTIAQSMNGFFIAKPIYLSICEYQQNCSIVSLQADTVHSKFYLVLKETKNKVELPLLNDTTSEYYEYLLGIGSGYETTFNGLAEELSINSIRKYKIGNRTLLVTHIGQSVQIPYKDYDKMIGRHRKEYTLSPSFVDIKQSIFYEPDVVHHSKGVDFFVWVN
ncbi:MAG: hypothetical protein IPL74_22450 [Bacteroidetes bacterium]|nr:hypothetical protein [Bacteroidota bacterium]